MRHLLALIASPFRDGNTHGLELAVEERVAVRKLISLDILAEEQVAVFVASDVALPLRQRWHASPYKAELGQIFAALRIKILLKRQLDEL